MCFHYDGDVDLYSRAFVRARKVRVCAGCCYQIAPKEQYERHRFRFEGHFYNEALCNKCVQLRLAIFVRELSHGCRPYDSWCPFDEIQNYAHDVGMPIPTRDVDLEPLHDAAMLEAGSA